MPFEIHWIVPLTLALFLLDVPCGVILSLALGAVIVMIAVTVVFSTSSGIMHRFCMFLLTLEQWL